MKGLGSRSFDSEGVKTETLKLVEQGVLKDYLIDTYNGKKLNKRSNGDVEEQVIYILKMEVFLIKTF